MPRSGSLLAELIPGTCVTASELPCSGESSRLQDVFIACCWYNSGDTRPVRAAIQNHMKRGYVWGDGQSNDDRAALVPTAVYWKLQRILKPPNLNGSCAVTSLSPCPPRPPSLCTAQTFLSLHRPWARGAHGPEQRPTQQRFSSRASVLGLCCSSRGLLLKTNIVNWDIISKHAAGCHRSTQCAQGHSELMPDARKCMESTLWWSKEELWQSSTQRDEVRTSHLDLFHKHLCEACPWSLLPIFRGNWALQDLLLDLEKFVILT